MASSGSKTSGPLSEFFREYNDILGVVPRLHDWGVLRWRGAMRRSLRLRDQRPATSARAGCGRVLIDYNERKSNDAKSVWGQVDFVNPYWLRPSFVERILIWLSLTLPRHHSKTLRACAMALTVRQRLGREVDLVVWNPYSIFHHAIIGFNDISSAYLLSPKYPIPRGKTKFIGHRVLKDIYSLKDSEFTATEPKARITSREKRVALYFTKLSEQDPREERLKEFAFFLIAHGIPTAIYLHYTDRDRAELSGLRTELLPSVRREPSIQDISSHQISVSGVSTIGLELLSNDLGHFVCYGERGDHSTIPLSPASSPYRQWLIRQPRGLARRSSDYEWVDQILRVEPERGRWLSDAVYGGRD